MHATSETDGKARVGDTFPTLELTATSGKLVTTPDPEGYFVHLQLRALRRLPDLQPSPTLDRRSP